MPQYEVEFSYKLPEWGSTTLTAENPDQAEEYALDYIKDLEENICDIQVEAIKELLN